MTDQPDRPPDPPGQHRTAPVSRRRFLGAVGGLTAGAAAVGVPSGMSSLRSPALDRPARDGVEPFYGAHQGGVTTSPQSHTYFASLDVTTDQRGELAELLRSWTAIIANLTSGRPATPMTGDPDRVEPDSGEALELGPARLTVNIGFGPGLFGVDGPDRFGLAARWPVQLVALPVFPGDALSGISRSLIRVGTPQRNGKFPTESSRAAPYGTGWRHHTKSGSQDGPPEKRKVNHE